MIESSRIRLLLVITTLLPQFYRTYKTHDISSFSLVFTTIVLILSTIWFITLLLNSKRDNYTLCEAGFLVLFYGFITVHIILQRTGKLKEGVAKDEDSLVSKDFLKELIGDIIFSGLEDIV